MSNEDRLKTLRAVIDRVIPADEFPSGSAAGVDRYIINLLQTDARKDLEPLESGLLALEQQKFRDLDPATQDALLQTLNNNPWFERLVELCMEGFYGDPGNGGNKDECSWKMIGYYPGAARK